MGFLRTFILFHGGPWKKNAGKTLEMGLVLPDPEGFWAGSAPQVVLGNPLAWRCLRKDQGKVELWGRNNKQK